MKKVLTLTLILGSLGMMNAQQTISSAQMTLESQADETVKGDSQLPLATAGLTKQGDKKLETVKSDSQLPLATAGLTKQGDKKLETVKSDSQLPLATAGLTKEGDKKLETVKSDSQLPLATAGLTKQGDKKLETVKHNNQLPLAIAGYSKEDDKKLETVKGDSQLPLATAGFEVEESVKVKKSSFPYFSGSKVTLDDFNVYPTLANDVVHITSNLDGLVQVVVFSLNGELKKNTRFEGSYDLDITDYAHGTYVVRIGRAGEVFTFKFVR